MNKKIKVVQYGLGPIGCRSVQYLTERGHFDLVGAIDSDERKVGVDVGELAELPTALGLHVTDDSTNLLKEVDAEVVVLNYIKPGANSAPGSGNYLLRQECGFHLRRTHVSLANQPQPGQRD